MRCVWSEHLLKEIVQYNVRYRDYLRAYGINVLIEQLVSIRHRIVFGREGLFEFYCSTYNEIDHKKIDEYTDVHIGEFYENYPTIDSSDSPYEDRSYQNFIFRKNQIKG